MALQKNNNKNNNNRQNKTPNKTITDIKWKLKYPIKEKQHNRLINTLQKLCPLAAIFGGKPHRFFTEAFVLLRFET